MAGKIKKMAKEVAKVGAAAMIPGGAVVKAALDIKGASGKIACRKKGGKWVKGKCVTSKGPLLGPDGIGRKGEGSPGRRPGYPSRPKPRKGRKKYPGTGDWYPERG